MNTWPRPSLSLLLALILSASGCAKRAHDQLAARSSDRSRSPSASSNQDQSRKININTAPAGELESLPGIGKALAARIIEQREKYGPFRRVEHLIIVRGISDKRFRALRELVTVD